MAVGVGTRIGSYEIVAALGAGRMDEVYRARDTRLDRDVAISCCPTPSRTTLSVWRASSAKRRRSPR